YHANYYGAFVLDPDGHNVEAVCHDPACAVGSGLDARCGPVSLPIQNLALDASPHVIPRYGGGRPGIDRLRLATIARQDLAHVPARRLILIEGMIGAAKSTTAQRLASRLTADGEDVRAFLESADNHPIRTEN